jgi:hypothetical protein
MSQIMPDARLAEGSYTSDQSSSKNIIVVSRPTKSIDWGLSIRTMNPPSPRIRKHRAPQRPLPDPLQTPQVGMISSVYYCEDIDAG